jgi:hypothetical protein
LSVLFVFGLVFSAEKYCYLMLRWEGGKVSKGKSRIFPSKMAIREFTYQKYLTSE